MVPRNEKSLERAHQDCIIKKVFVRISKESYRDYLDEALSDLASAQKELMEGDVKWAVVKAYQALFFQCSAVLVKNLGIYSKDHGCLINVLLKNNLVKNDVLEQISNMLKHKNSLYDEIDEIRIFRNKALYFPKAQRKLASEESQISD